MAGGSGFAAMPVQAADLIGDEVSCTQTGSGTFDCARANTTIGAGVEFTTGLGSDRLLSFDFDDTMLTVSALRNGRLGGTIIELSNISNAFSSFGFINSSISGFDGSDVSLIDGVLRLDFIGTRFVEGDSATLAVNSVSAAVPEPATWLMLLFGFAAIGATMRTRQARPHGAPQLLVRSVQMGKRPRFGRKRGLFFRLSQTGHQYICWPPLTLMVDPVTKPASSAHRKLTARAISSA